VELGLSTRFNPHAFIASHSRSLRFVNAVSCTFSHFPSSPRISTCLSAALGVALAPRISSKSITARTHQRSMQMQQIARRTGTFDTSRDLFFIQSFLASLMPRFSPNVAVALLHSPLKAARVPRAASARCTSSFAVHTRRAPLAHASV
jgi:hypothetical protein